MKGRRRSESTVLTQHQIEQVLRACLDLIDRLVIGLALFMGMKVSEIVHMRSDWVTGEGDIRIPSEQICRCAECARERNGVWRPQGKAGARTLSIPKRLRRDLAELFKMQPDGLGLSRVGLYDRVQAIFKRAKVKHGSTNTLRKTCFYLLAQADMPSDALAYFAGVQTIELGTPNVPLAKAKEEALQRAKAIFG